MRAAIYARYSSDLQSKHSIEDQLTLCRERALSLEADIIGEYTDAAISGSHLLNRPGVRKLLADARAGTFDILIAEALDRLSRGQADTATIFERLTHYGVKIVTLSEGDVSELHVGLKGTMNALFLKDLGAKVRRGQRGRAEAGRAAGGSAYGYEVVREIGPDGDLVRGKRVIDPDQAQVVRDIFVWYLAGLSPRAIAGRLNAANIPSPRGGRWNASTINGNRARGNGILHNALYVGRLTYNRQQFRKDPDTGKRLPRINSSDDWIISEVPELRIIDQASWNRVQRQKQRLGNLPISYQRRPKYLLAGLLVCGCCNGNYVKADGKRLGCATHKESRACGNGRKVVSSLLEDRVLAGVREQLLNPDVVSEFIQAYHEAWSRDRGDIKRQHAEAEKRLRDVGTRIARIVEAIADGTAPKALRASLTALEAEQEQLQDQLAEFIDPSVIDLHTDLASLYHRQVEQLSASLSRPDMRLEAIHILRRIIDRIVIYPSEKRGKFDVEVYGQIAAMIDPAASRSGAGPNWVRKVVAAEGFGHIHPTAPLVARLEI